MIRSVVKNIITSPLRMVRRTLAKSSVGKLMLHPHVKVRAVGMALSETLNNVLSTDERDWIKRIEDRRKSLLNSDQEISVIAYGAGTPSTTRTMEEMKAGVQSKGLVRNISKASKAPFWAKLLFKLIRTLKPSTCIELGSCVGISASYMSAAFKLNGGGVLKTLEGSPGTAEVAKESLQSLGFENATVVVGPFHATLAGVLQTAKPIDFFFNDGHHHRDAVLEYFEQSLPFLTEDAVIIVDDISWSPGMRNAWEQIENDERVLITVDLQHIGIAILGKQPGAKEKYRIPL